MFSQVHDVTIVSNQNITTISFCDKQKYFFPIHSFQSGLIKVVHFITIQYKSSNLVLPITKFVIIYMR